MNVIDMLCEHSSSASFGKTLDGHLGAAMLRGEKDQTTVVVTFSPNEIGTIDMAVDAFDSGGQRLPVRGVKYRGVEMRLCPECARLIAGAPDMARQLWISEMTMRCEICSVERAKIDKEIDE